jgi:hypothetical protein
VTTFYGVSTPVSVAVQDPNGDALTVAWTLDGVTVRTDTVPATSQSTTLALTQNYGSVGTHAVSVDATDVKNLTTSCSTTVHVAKASQTIDFAPIADHTFGDSPFVLSATASSNLPPTFSVVAGSAVVTTGNAVTILGTGVVTVRASHSGNDNYHPAPDVDRSFSINRAGSSVTLTSSLNPSFHGQRVTFSATTAVPPNTAVPTGTMTLLDGGAAISTPQPLDSNGQAAIAVDDLDIRDHAIAAVYSGDGLFEGSASAVLVQSVPNRSPHVSLPPSLTTSEGAAAVTLTPDADDPDGDPITFTWTLFSGTGELAAEGSTASYANSDGPATSVVRVTATDSHGGSATADVTITVNNVAPAISSVIGPAAPLLMGSAATISVTYTDPGTLDTLTCRYTWGDGTADTSVDGVSGACSASHSYAAPGVYAVSSVVTDDDTGAATEPFKYVVVYSPAAGSVTGGGWLMSPSGALTANAGLTGRANFGFNAKYQGETPVGQTEFQFQNGNLNFHSTSYAWLVVSGATAEYQGTGRINGSGPYQFLASVVDGKMAGTNVDRVRLKIWQASTGAVIYDDQPGAGDNASATTPLSGGSITIHH